MMKKIGVILLSLIMCLGFTSVLAGCGGKKGVEIYVSAHEGAYGKAFWSDIKTAFEEEFKSKNYKVKIDAAEDIDTKLKTQLGTPLSPDVVYLGTNQKAGFVLNSIVKTKADTLLLDLTDTLNANVPGESVKLKDKINGDFLGIKATNPFDDNKTYMLPLFYSVNGVYYNKDIVGTQTLPKTYAQMAAINKGSKDLFSYPRGGYLDNLMIAGAKATLSTEDYAKWLTNGYSDTMYADDGSYAQLFKDLGLLKAGFPSNFDPVAGTLQDVTANTAHFYAGNVGFFPGGSFMSTDAISWKVNGMTEEQINTFNKEKVGFMAYPSVTTSQTNYVTSMVEQIYAIKTGNAEREEAAKAFTSFMFSDVAVKIMAKNNAMVPVKNCEALAKDAGMNSFVLDIFGTIADATTIFDSLPNGAIEGGANFKTVTCFGMNEAMGVAGSTVTGAEWFGKVKTWARTFNKIA